MMLFQRATIRARRVADLVSAGPLAPSFLSGYPSPGFAFVPTFAISDHPADRAGHPSFFLQTTPNIAPVFVPLHAGAPFNTMKKRYRPRVDQFKTSWGTLYEGCVVDQDNRRVLCVPVKVNHARAVRVAIEAFRELNGGPCPEREADLLSSPKVRP